MLRTRAHARVVFSTRCLAAASRFGGSPAPVQAAPIQEAPPACRCAQVSPSELVLRFDRWRTRCVSSPGWFEQLQYRNQQLEQQLRRGDAGWGSAAGSAQIVQPAQPPLPPDRRPSAASGRTGGSERKPRTCPARRPRRSGGGMSSTPREPERARCAACFSLAPARPQRDYCGRRHDAPAGRPVGAAGGRQARRAARPLDALRPGCA